MRHDLLPSLRAGLALFLLISTAVILYTTVQNTRSARSLADRVVAYARIASRDGEILFHTNPRLVGSRLAGDELNRSWPAGTFLGRRVILGTGLPAYEFHNEIHRPDGSPVLLTLVLHTASVDRIVTDSRRMWWTVGGVLIQLWGIGILSERIFTRHLRLEEELETRKQLALIGQMTAVLAHEIRNALGSIKGYAQWVDEKLEEPDPKKAGLSVVRRSASSKGWAGPNPFPWMSGSCPQRTRISGPRSLRVDSGTIFITDSTSSRLLCRRLLTGGKRFSLWPNFSRANSPPPSGRRSPGSRTRRNPLCLPMNGRATSGSCKT